LGRKYGAVNMAPGLSVNSSLKKNNAQIKNNGQLMFWLSHKLVILRCCINCSERTNIKLVAKWAAKASYVVNPLIIYYLA
jgi:hypothetical protein